MERRAWRLMCAVLLALSAAGLSIPVVAEESAAPEAAVEGHGKLGAPPVVFVFDRDGKRVKQFEGGVMEFSYADVEKVVQGLLGQAP